MMWYWGSGYGWGMALFGVVVMFVFWGGIALAIVYLVRSLDGSRPTQRDIAIDTLRRRLAEGDISSEEFERISKVLQG
jgi:putative membrane protein